MLEALVSKLHTTCSYVLICLCDRGCIVHMSLKPLPGAGVVCVRVMYSQVYFLLQLISWLWIDSKQFFWMYFLHVHCFLTHFSTQVLWVRTQAFYFPQPIYCMCLGVPCVRACMCVHTCVCVFANVIRCYQSGDTRCGLSSSAGAWLDKIDKPLHTSSLSRVCVFWEYIQ